MEAYAYVPNLLTNDDNADSWQKVVVNIVWKGKGSNFFFCSHGGMASQNTGMLQI